jgi:putative phosphoribosyl transferase
MRFDDRADAGRRLAEALAEYAGRDDVVVLALPRGGVPVAFEVAQRLDVPLDVMVTRKLGVPGHEELAMGAVASGGVQFVNRALVDALGVDERDIALVTERESAELARREHAYRGDRPPPDVEGRTVILVDDGIATGATLRAAAIALLERGPERLVIAAPTGAPDSAEALREVADEVLCLDTPEPYVAVGAWYRSFGQVDDATVTELLDRHARSRQEAPPRR